MTIELPEPVGAVYTINGILHCTLTQEPSETNLFTEAQMLAFRDAALEEAAKACDRLHGLRNDECADYIRALKSSKAITDSAKIRAAFEGDYEGTPV